MGYSRDMNFRLIRRVLLILGIGIAIWALLIPLFTGKTSNEKIGDITRSPRPSALPGSRPTVTPQPQVLVTSALIPQNNEHVEGHASLIKDGNTYFIRLEDDFKATNGPDLYVGFGTDQKVDLASLFAKLKANNGGQNYQVPVNIDPTKYSSIFVYCKFFRVSFGYAPLVGN